MYFIYLFYPSLSNVRSLLLSLFFSFLFLSPLPATFCPFHSLLLSSFPPLRIHNTEESRMNTPLEELIPFLGAWGLYGLIGAVSRHQQQYSSTQRLFFLCCLFHLLQHKAQQRVRHQLLLGACVWAIYIETIDVSGTRNHHRQSVSGSLVAPCLSRMAGTKRPSVHCTVVIDALSLLLFNT